MAEEFNEWMKRIKNQYYSDNERMTDAFEKLRKIAKNKNYEDNSKYNTMASRSQIIYMVR